MIQCERNNLVERMKVHSRLFVILALVASLALSTACFGLPAAVSESKPAATVDLVALTNTAVAQVQAQTAQSATEEDAQALRATIESVVQENLPDPDLDALAQLVDEAVTARLAQLEQRTAIDLPSATLAGDGLELQDTLMALYQQANPSVVYIITSTGSGSGFVYDAAGHIVTNNHVVSGSRGFEIVFSNGDRQRGQLVGVDPDSDLAVLQVEALPDGVQPLPLAEAEGLQVGEFVVAIGNPFGEQGSMSVGIVSGLGRSLRSQRGQTSMGGSAYSLPSVIQTDAPINPGNSGGPLLNLAGQVVGVNSAIASITGVNSGVGFSIPVIAVQRIVPSLIEQGSYIYSYMGVSFDDEISLSNQAQFDLPQTRGAYVVGVSSDSPAGRAGLRAADPNTGRGGDLVVAIDGRSVRDFNELNSYLVFSTEPGQVIELTVLRDGAELTLSVTLGARQ
mgnify:FL=1